jgi:hypothetical protein
MGTQAMRMVKPKTISSPKAPHSVMKNAHGAVIVRHPALPGKDMMPPSPDYAEIPYGSLSSHNSPGGITGGLGPYQSEAGAEGGEYTNG